MRIGYYINILGVLATLALGSASPAVIAAPDGQVARLLSQMSSALREQDYQGLFTYEAGGALATYKLVHQVRDGVEYERLQKLNGREHEILRSGQRPECVSRGHQLFRKLLQRLDARPASIPNHYEFRVRKPQRIAGREATIVEVLPMDNHRYGYVLGIDTLSSLPLQILLVDDRKRVLERIHFVDLELGEIRGETALLPRSDQYRQAGNDLIHCDVTQADPTPAGWRLQWLPPGFEYAGQRQAEGGERMLTYTDGLATFSVFVSDVSRGQRYQGRAQTGATMAYVTQKEWARQSYRVAVVGEIPLATAQRVVAGLQKEQSPVSILQRR